MLARSTILRIYRITQSNWWRLPSFYDKLNIAETKTTSQAKTDSHLYSNLRNFAYICILNSVPTISIVIIWQDIGISTNSW